ncbi:hypothetical protein C6503_07530 [Candidatus Poribacteria bacterium]|nr:MAG: hypothetical protein C6503_07530 [Candidatus Poribacteria bacterium]
MPSKQIRGLLLVILLNTTLLSFADSEEPFAYYTPENILKFADFLYAQGDYLRAADEYQRYLFYQPQESTQIHYKIAVCYRFGGKTEQAIQGFEALLRTAPESQFASRAYYQIGATYFLQGQFERSVQFLGEALPRIMDARQHAEAEQLIGLSYLKQKQWSEASEIFKALQASDIIPIREKAEVYQIYAEKGADLPTRSPFLAGTLSTVIPGTGRLYTGRFADALTTLFTVGLTGWQAYDGFRRDGISSAKGWTLGTLCGIFYVGNIYGSVISARVYNRHVTEEFLATLTVELPY